MRNNDNLVQCERWIGKAPKSGQDKIEHPLFKKIILEIRDNDDIPNLKLFVNENNWLVNHVVVPESLTSDAKDICNRYGIPVKNAVADPIVEGVQLYSPAIWSIKPTKVLRVFNKEQVITRAASMSIPDVAMLIARTTLAPSCMTLFANKYKGTMFLLDISNVRSSAIKWLMHGIIYSVDVHEMLHDRWYEHCISYLIETYGSFRNSELADEYEMLFNADMFAYCKREMVQKADLHTLERSIPKS